MDRYFYIRRLTHEGNPFGPAYPLFLPAKDAAAIPLAD
jgi:hypothetical protein